MTRFLAIGLMVLAGCASTKPSEQESECTQLRRELREVQAKYDFALQAQKSQPNPENDRAVANFAGDISAYNSALAAGSCQ